MVRSVEARENTNASALYAAFHALTGRIAFRGLSRLPLAAAFEKKTRRTWTTGHISTEAVSTS